MANAEVEFMGVIDEHLAAFGPKTRAQVAKALEAGVTIVVDSKLDAAAVKRAMAWAVRSAEEAAAEADERESRRTRPPATEEAPPSDGRADQGSASSLDLTENATTGSGAEPSDAVDDFKAKTGL